MHGAGKFRAILVAAVAMSAWTVCVHAADLPEHSFKEDKEVTPTLPNLTAFTDGKLRSVEAIVDDSGAQRDFVADEVVLATNANAVLADFLKRWQGKLLTTLPRKTEHEVTRHLVRINPDLSRLDDLQRYVQQTKLTSQVYRVSSARGLHLLAAVAAEKALGKADVDANWVAYGNLITPETRGKFTVIDKALQMNCGELLREEIQLVRDLQAGGPKSILAEYQLGAKLGSVDHCRPQVPTFNLIAGSTGLILPEVEPGTDFKYILQPPASVAQGFTAQLVSSALGTTVPQPLPTTLYQGAVNLNTDGKQLALVTQLPLPPCARSEDFTVRLSNGASHTDFRVTLPVSLKIRGRNAYIGGQDYVLHPGQNLNEIICAGGDRGPMQWTWSGIGGDPFPPPGLSLSTAANGNAVISGTVQTLSYHTNGKLQVRQGSKIATTDISFEVALRYDPSFSTPCSATQVIIPEIAFQCEMPKPSGYSTYTWSIANGTLPPGNSNPAVPGLPGLNLVKRGPTWYVTGTVPFWSSSCVLCQTSSNIKVFPLVFNLTSPGYTGILATRQITFDVQVPFRVWTQNTFIRPNNPFVPNTGDDNSERTQMVINRVNAGTFDFVALQEMFDADQSYQLAIGIPNSSYQTVWGPGEDTTLGITTTEDSGLALIAKTSLNSGLERPSWRHHAEVFTAEPEGSDSWANKGFTATLVQVSPLESFYIVNTHMQAGEEAVHAQIRHSQLIQLMNYIASLPETCPVLLMGDLNIAAENINGSEYKARMADVFAGWEDAVTTARGEPASLPTDDKTHNAYNHFWDSHIWDHMLENEFIRSGRSFCVSIALGLGMNPALCTSPIPHPTAVKRLDHIMIRQGTEYRLVVESASLEDMSATAALCRDRFQPEFADSGHGSLRCYLSDHFGLSAKLRFAHR